MMFGKLTEAQFKSELTRVFGNIDVEKVVSVDEKNNAPSHIAKRIMDVFEETGDIFAPEDPVSIQGFEISIDMCAENAFDKRLAIEGVNDVKGKFSFISETAIPFLVDMIMGSFTLQLENSHLDIRGRLSLHGMIYVKNSKIKVSQQARLDNVRVFDSVLDCGDLALVDSTLDEVKTTNPSDSNVTVRFSTLYKVIHRGFTNIEYCGINGVSLENCSLGYSCVSLNTGRFVNVKANNVVLKAETIKANIMDALTIANGGEYTTLLLTDNGPLVNDQQGEPRFLTLTNWHLERVNNNKNFVTHKRNNDLYELMKTKSDMFDATRR